jgi:hypothetical protein
MGGGISKVVEEWKSEDGKQWYRVWSSGFVEQGGTSSVTTAGFQGVISLVKPFSQTNYAVTFCAAVPSRTADDYYSHNIEKRDTTTFTFSDTMVRSTTANFLWYACGY